MVAQRIAFAGAGIALGVVLGFAGAAVVFAPGAELPVHPKQTPTPVMHTVTPEELEECPPPDDLAEGEGWICARLDDWGVSTNR